MKLKYYMRGLGIGIILTTLILTLGNPKEKLTDQEVISRAQSLGMVMGKDNNPNLDKLLKGINPTEGASDVSAAPGAEPTGQAAKEPAATPSAAPTLAPTSAPTLAPTSAPTLTPTSVPAAEPTQAPTPVPTIEPMPTIKPTIAPIPTEIPVSDNGPDNSNEISFTIKSGMSSGKVAALLNEIGLIDNSDEFNRFIVASGKASIIRVGTYSMPKESTYEEIVTKITSK